MKTTFTLKTNNLITRYENYATAIENLANNLATALLNNETFETEGNRAHRANKKKG